MVALQAVRTENVTMVKAYFMVQGMKYLLNLHNCTDEGQGGRTLMHTAYWCEDATRLLCCS